MSDSVPETPWTSVAEAERFGDSLVSAMTTGPQVTADGRHIWTLSHGRTWEARAYQRLGKLFRPVAPGIYCDDDDSLVFNMPELLRLVDLDDTVKNRAVLEDLLAAVVPPGLPLEFLPDDA